MKTLKHMMCRKRGESVKQKAGQKEKQKEKPKEKRSLLELLEDIGTVPEDVKTRILKERDLVTLGQWRKGAARAKSVEQFVADCLEFEEK